MTYGLVLLLHLLAAIAFVGTVFFEVVMLEGVRKRLPPAVMREVETAIGNRAVRVMPWVLLTLYAAGITLAWQYRSVLAQPLASTFGLQLTVKILLAISVAGQPRNASSAISACRSRRGIGRRRGFLRSLKNTVTRCARRRCMNSSGWPCGN